MQLDFKIVVFGKLAVKVNWQLIALSVMAATRFEKGCKYFETTFSKIIHNARKQNTT